MQLREVLVIVVFAACRKEAGSPDRAVPVVAEAATATPITPAASGSAAVTPHHGPPPGDDKLTDVPAAIAAKIELVEVARGLSRPVLVVVAPGDPRKRMFILEQHVGRIRIVEHGKLLPKPFFTIDNKLSTGNEQGLLGLAFHPDFQNTGRLFVNYTAADKDSHIVEYKVSSADPNAVDMTSRREIIEIDQPYSNHNGGHIAFGPDGKLYAGMGDGGSAGDPQRNGQNPTALLGKMLRFDVEPRGRKPRPEIVHTGLRNPWRFSFDPKTGALYIADVGQNLWENVFVVNGTDGVSHNFGWNVVEGAHCFEARKCDKTAFTPPVAEYQHNEGCSIIGGFVYRGKALPELAGRYFYSDFCTGLLRSFTWTYDASSPKAPGWIRDHWSWKAAIDRRGVLTQVTSFGTDHDGELYIVLLTGSIYKLARRG